ncbi:MAG: hypothetical protein DVB22_000892 [Verrucomicrobia bacterium]|jgi:hypothetical protein|nr:MAG: hypothetical protein DVB22_000892 [Verrucomicrobiota bacterium]
MSQSGRSYSTPPAFQPAEDPDDIPELSDDLEQQIDDAIAETGLSRNDIIRLSIKRGLEIIAAPKGRPDQPS